MDESDEGSEEAVVGMPAVELGVVTSGGTSLGEKVVVGVALGEVSTGELDRGELVVSELVAGELDFVDVGELVCDELAPPRPPWTPLPLPPSFLGIISMSRQ